MRALQLAIGIHCACEPRRVSTRCCDEHVIHAARINHGAASSMNNWRVPLAALRRRTIRRHGGTRASMVDKNGLRIRERICHRDGVGVRTLHPFGANSFAVARPKPEELPVMKIAFCS